MGRSLRNMIFAACFAGVPGVFGSGAPAFAQTDLSGRLSGRISAETERRLRAEDEAARLRQDGPGVLADPLARRDLPAPGGPTIVLSSITFTPDSAFLSVSELDAIRARYVGRSVDFSQLSEIVRDVNDLYAEKGVVTAAAVLAPQDLEGGNFVVTLVEGQVGVVGVVGAEQIGPDFILNRVRFARDTTVDVPTAARDISYFNQTNRAQIRLLLQPGAAFGLTDLVFGISEPAPKQLQFFLDNNGVASTGDIRGSMIFRRYGGLGIDDTFLLYLERSEGSRSATARFDFPFNPAGTRIAFSGALSDYRVVAGPSVGLSLTGWARSASVTVTQPLIATDSILLQMSGSAFQGVSASFSAGVPLVNADTSKFSAGLSLGAFGDTWSLGAQVQAISATVKDRIAGSTSSHNIVAGSLDGVYRFQNELAFIARGAWQYSEDALLPGGLLFQIGGPTTVRGFPSDGVAGDSGYYANFELHRGFTLRDTPITGFVFADIGEVFSTFPASTTLISAGLGASYIHNKSTRFDIVAATPLRRALANQSDLTVSATLTFTRF
jgi:hemolysin activation/secretion protein